MRGIIVFCFALTLISACFKIDSPNKPYAHETFQGNMDIRFGIKGMTAGADAINFAILKTAEDGKTIKIAQIPNANFELFPKEMFEGMRDALKKTPDHEDTLLYQAIMEIDVPGAGFEDKSKFISTPDFAGLLGEVNGNVITVEGFARSNDTLKMLQCGARGELLRDGDIVYTTKTIEIFCPLEVMLDFFGPHLLSYLRRESDGKKLSHLVDEVEDFIVWYIDLLMPQPMTLST
ncbi:MAG TPA: hypothetical protein PKC21_01105 [Oligoflexia bacterium]|nr:hypothetical protein [Oligoflexia bacterium]HMR23927.1 hypothetical protein [Oligoflexia bacterium]